MLLTLFDDHIWCDSQYQEEVISPDGSNVASVGQWICGGAVGSAYTDVRLRRTIDAIGIRTARVIVLPGGSAVKVLWRDTSTLDITYSQIPRTDVLRQWNEISILYNTQ
jgi:hypothetical protein